MGRGQGWVTRERDQGNVGNIGNSTITTDGRLASLNIYTYLKYLR